MTKEPIAIVGMGCRFPGASGIDEFWELLRDGVDATTATPADRYDAEALYSERPAPGRVISKRSGYIKGIDRFDPGFFGMSAAEAKFLDPQQRLMMMAAYEAFEDAGLTLPEIHGSRTGVYVGNMHIDYWSLLAKRGLTALSPSAIFNYLSILSGRLSYTFDLRGPSMSLDTACSSSLVAVHLACQSLRCGETDMALASGVNIKLTPDEDVLLSQVRMLAPDGRCKFGDQSANGFAPSDGVGVVVLKRLSDAVANGDRIRAVLLGSATCNDGATSGSLLAPSVEMHAQMLRWAYDDAGIEPSEVDFIEAHGTGTPMIDPIEFQALAQVVGAGRPLDQPCLVGSVKTNIGHTEGAAGVAALIKTVLCLEHRHVVPSLHCNVPNPKIPWDDIPLAVPTQGQALAQTDKRLIAGISGQGISCANTHLVVAESVDRRPDIADPGGRYEFSVSARGLPALREQVAAFAAYCQPGQPGRGYALRDLSFSSLLRRTQHPDRVQFSASSHDELVQQLQAYLDGHATGQAAPARQTSESTEETANDASKTSKTSKTSTAGPGARFVPLPTYRWQLGSYWLPDAQTEPGSIPPELAGRA